MSIHVALRHTTVYKFDRRVTLGPHIVRLRPAPHSRTPILAYTLKISPEKHFINWQQDPFGNYLARLVFPEATREFSVDVEVIADLTVINPFDYFVEDSAEFWPFDYNAELKRELTPYLETEPAGPLLQAWLAARSQRLSDFDSVAYSDSINDLPLLQAVDRAVAVDPDQRLRAHAQAHGWEILLLAR